MRSEGERAKNPEKGAKKQPGTWLDYERIKQSWLAENPFACAAEVTRACRRIAADLGL